MKEDHFLSEILERPCAVVTQWGPPWDFGDHDFLTLKANNLGCFREAISRGFKYVTTNVHLERAENNGQLSKFRRLERKFTIGLLRKSDISEVLKTAKMCFTLDRFHQDPKLSKHLADLIHERWVENDCKGRADRVIVARVKGKAVGFIALCGRAIDLMAVQTEFANQGIGSALLLEALERCSVRETVTQINNRVLSLYRRAGFVPSKIYHVLHWWRK